MMENLEIVFENWFQQQRQSYMLSREVKKLLFKAFLEGISYRENNHKPSTDN